MSTGEITENNHETKRQKDWIRKCVSNFSLYSHLVGDRVEDPHEQLQAIESGEFKAKLSKSAKKRMRKKRKMTTADVFKKSTKSATNKKLERLIKLKRTKKDMKIMINKLSKMPL